MFKGEGDMSPTSIPADLIVKVTVTNDTEFVRDGNHLRKNAHIDFVESLIGFKKQIEYIDGSVIPIDKIGVSQFEEEIRISNKGF